jgi:hypothetical protein
VLGKGRTHIGGIPAVFFKVEMLRETPAGPIHGIQMQFFVLRKGKLFSIGCGSKPERFKADLPLYLKSLALFIFEDDFHRSQKAK